MKDGNETIKRSSRYGDSQGKKSDEELMSAYQDGDIRAFELLYERYSRRVYGYLVKRISDRVTIDDVFQAIFLKLHQARHQYDPSLDFKPWLFSICRTALVDKFRANARLPQTVELDESQIAIKEEKADSVIVNLEALSSDQRSAIKMRYYEDQSFDEIAKKMNKTAGGVRQLVSRGIRRLSKALKFKEGGL